MLGPRNAQIKMSGASDEADPSRATRNLARDSRALKSARDSWRTSTVVCSDAGDGSGSRRPGGSWGCHIEGIVAAPRGEPQPCCRGGDRGRRVDGPRQRGALRLTYSTVRICQSGAAGPGFSLFPVLRAVVELTVDLMRMGRTQLHVAGLAFRDRPVAEPIALLTTARDLTRLRSSLIAAAEDCASPVWERDVVTAHTALRGANTSVAIHISGGSKHFSIVSTW